MAADVEGVPLGQLCCPTCRERYRLPVDVQANEPEDTYIIGTSLETQFVPAPRFYIVCQYGHKWSLKTITRRMNEPDRILLGQYLGTE